MKKLLSILDLHGCVYTVHDSEVHAFCYGFTNDYDIITIDENGKYIVMTCDGEKMPLLVWLGY